MAGGQGIAGVGQSSWGPTGFALLGSDATGRRSCAARRSGASLRSLRFLVTRARNRGAEIDVAD